MPDWPVRRSYKADQLRLGSELWSWSSRTFIMGIIHATADSFSGDGIAGDVDAAVALATQMESDGADILDVGGCSTRPGGDDPSEGEELRLVLPVIAALTQSCEIPISIDTYRVAVARKALSAGALMVNDVTGLRAEPELARVVAEFGGAVTVMHNQRGREHNDVVRDIRDGLEISIEIALNAGIDPGKILIDPGFGFGWEVHQNIEMLRRLEELHGLGFPILIGTSRKSTIGAVLDAEVDQRMLGTAATTALAVASGVDVARVHDVGEMKDVVVMADAIVRGFDSR